jgi:hypothetical protein
MNLIKILSRTKIIIPLFVRLVESKFKNKIPIRGKSRNSVVRPPDVPLTSDHFYGAFQAKPHIFHFWNFFGLRGEKTTPRPPSASDGYHTTPRAPLRPPWPLINTLSRIWVVFPRISLISFEIPLIIRISNRNTHWSEQYSPFYRVINSIFGGSLNKIWLIFILQNQVALISGEITLKNLYSANVW